MNGSSPMLDGWSWIWQIDPVWTLLLMMVAALVAFRLVTNTPDPTTAATPSATE